MKNDHTTAGDRAVVAYAHWLLRWRWAAIAVSLAVAALAGYGAQHLSFNNNYRVFFSEDNPQRTAFDRIQNTYTRNDTILFTVTPAGGESSPQSSPSESFMHADTLSFGAAPGKVTFEASSQSVLSATWAAG